MTTKSEIVKSWRRKTKQRLIDASGGKCCVCGYNKCSNALEFHHINPSEKEVPISGLRTSAKSWEDIIKEVEKCILVCANCHREIHSGMIDISNISHIKVEEKYVEYKKYEKLEKMDKCPVCGGLKPITNITCSPKCSAYKRRKIDWDSIDLKKELESCSILALSRRLGCCDVAIHKRLKKLNIGK